MCRIGLRYVTSWNTGMRRIGLQMAVRTTLFSFGLKLEIGVQIIRVRVRVRVRLTNGIGIRLHIVLRVGEQRLITITTINHDS